MSGSTALRQIAATKTRDVLVSMLGPHTSKTDAADVFVGCLAGVMWPWLVASHDPEQVRASIHEAVDAHLKVMIEALPPKDAD